MKIQLITLDQTTEIDFYDLLKSHNQTLIYFYPRDNTPGCSLEARDFSLYYPNFLKKGIGVIGISKDSEKSHYNFIAKHSLAIPLISDEKLVLHQLLGAWGEKSNYGKITMGTIRSTFLLNQKGDVLKAWRNVKATGHVERVMKELAV